ncbi:MAG: sugar-binding domain-containing protein, partial [Ilumatobacteraceae bacterium]
MLPVIGELRPWTDPQVVSLHRLDMSPPAAVHVDDARDAASTSWRRSLDGRWDFRLFESPDAVPASAISRPVNTTWRKVSVPGNWTLQDVGDLPQYTNVRMPFHGPPPRLPEHNPTGVYRRQVTIPKRWNGRQIIVHIGGAESVHAVYVNGDFAGYGTDSRLASEYDISEFVDAGTNEIAIVVSRWSAHSYIEDQDQWWMAGLHREVFVEARAPIHVTSLACDAGLVGEDGVVRVAATVGGVAPPSDGWTVRFHLETIRGRRIGRRVTSPVPHRFATPYLFSGHDAVATLTVPAVQRWSAESPT